MQRNAAIGRTAIHRSSPSPSTPNPLILTHESISGRWKALKLLSAAVTGFALLSVVATYAAGDSNPQTPFLAPHEPIVIEGDAGFTRANGVVSGRGTSRDPYVIAGWNVYVSGSPGIIIRNTTALFVLRDIVLLAAFDGAYEGVILQNVTNARIENVTSEFNRAAVLLDGVHSAMVTENTWNGNHRGIHILSSTDVTVTRNRARGGPVGLVHILAVDSTRVTIESNLLNPTYGAAIGAARSRDVAIVNNTVVSMGPGLLLEEVSEISVRENNYTWYQDIDFRALGFGIFRSTNVTVNANQFRGYEGHVVERSANTTLDGNAISGFISGVALFSSHGIRLANNVFEAGGVQIVGSELSEYDSHVIEATNTVAGRRIGYHVGCVNVRVDGAAYAQVIAVNCRGVHVGNLSSSWVLVGLHSVLSENVTVEGAHMVGALTGILAEASPNVTVVDSTLTLGAFGIHLLGTRGFSVRNNRIWEYAQGLAIWSSSDGAATGNTLTNNSAALQLFTSSRVALSENRVAGNRFEGIWLSESEDVVIDRNEVLGNQYGITLAASSFVRIRHNDMMGNQVQARVEGGNENRWDDGYPSGGNYWDDYAGWDDCSGPAQDDCKGPDGLGDVPYVIGGGPAVDRYPLVPVRVANELTVARIESLRGPFRVGETVAFYGGNSYDPDGAVVRYAWSFGDGATAEGPEGSHAYVAAGNYTVTLDVQDNRRGTNSTRLRVEVLATRPPPDIPLVTYEHGSGFRLPVPRDWTRQVDVLEEGSVTELVLETTIAGYPVIIAVDTDLDPTLREDETSLRDLGLDAFRAIQAEQPDATLVEGPTALTVSGHGAVRFLIRYTSFGVLQDFVAVVSDPHDRYWLLVLTALEPAYADVVDVFDYMVAEFEVTLGPPSPPGPFGNPLVVLAVGGAAAGAVAALVGFLLVRRRKAVPLAPLSSIRPMPGPSYQGVAAHGASFCPHCGTPVASGQRFCGRCGGAMPPPGPPPLP